jgi:hypothetical protein
MGSYFWPTALLSVFQGGTSAKLQRQKYLVACDRKKKETQWLLLIISLLYMDTGEVQHPGEFV